MASARSVQCEAASLSTEESEARPRYLQSPSPPPQPFLEVNQYLDDDFLGCIDPLSEFGLEDALPPHEDLQGSFYWSADQGKGMQQGSSTSGAQHDTERSRVPSPFSLEFPDFYDIVDMAPLVMEQALPSNSCSGAKQERLSPSPSQHNVHSSRTSLVQDSAGDSAATQYHMRALSPALSPGDQSQLSPPAAPYSPLLAHPVTPHRTPRRPNAGRSPPYTSQPLMAAPEEPHKHPDFATIYAFLGSLFDPDLVHIDHADVLAQMAPVDRETACLLMNNMAANIADPAALAAHVEAAVQMEAAGAARAPPPPPQLRQMMVPQMYPENTPAARNVHVPAHAQHLRQYGSTPVYAMPHTI